MALKQRFGKGRSRNYIVEQTWETRPIAGADYTLTMTPSQMLKGGRVRYVRITATAWAASGSVGFYLNDVLQGSTLAIDNVGDKVYSGTIIADNWNITNTFAFKGTGVNISLVTAVVGREIE